MAGRLYAGTRRALLARRTGHSPRVASGSRVRREGVRGVNTQLLLPNFQSFPVPAAEKDHQLKPVYDQGDASKASAGLGPLANEAGYADVCNSPVLRRF